MGLVAAGAPGAVMVGAPGAVVSGAMLCRGGPPAGGISVIDQPRCYFFAEAAGRMACSTLGNHSEGIVEGVHRASG